MIDRRMRERSCKVDRTRQQEEASGRLLLVRVDPFWGRTQHGFLLIRTSGTAAIISLIAPTMIPMMAMIQLPSGCCLPAESCRTEGKRYRRPDTRVRGGSINQYYASTDYFPSAAAFIFHSAALSRRSNIHFLFVAFSQSPQQHADASSVFAAGLLSTEQ